MSNAPAAPMAGAEAPADDGRPTADDRTAQVETLVAASELFARSKNRSTAGCRQKMVAKEVRQPFGSQRLLLRYPEKVVPPWLRAHRLPLRALYL